MTLEVVRQLAREVATPTGALFGVGALAVAFTFWRHAVAVEVYAFNLVFVALILLLAVRGVERREGRHAVALAAL